MSRRAIWIPLCAAVASCVSTPIPQPPPDSLDIGKIVLPDTWPTTTALSFSGRPGAAPPNSRLRVTNLDTDVPPVEVDVAGDGSFQVTISFSLEDELRLQVRTVEERQPPIDVVLGDIGFEPAPRVDCFTAPLEVDLGAVSAGGTADAAIVLDNDCADDAQIDAAFFRTDDPSFVFVGAPPSSVPAGAEADLDTRFAPTAAGDAEEIVLVELVVDGSAVRYPVTLFGTSP